MGPARCVKPSRHSLLWICDERIIERKGDQQKNNGGKKTNEAKKKTGI